VTLDRTLARSFVLAAWSLFFLWLWLGGEATRYLGPRTLWVVPFGALTLGGAAIAGFAAARDDRGRRVPLGRREAITAAVLLLPMLAVAAVPRAQLGSLAASNKASTGTFAGAGALLGTPSDDGAVSFRDIHYANQSEEYALERGIGEALKVELVGFVTNAPEGAGDRLELTRFYVSCCAADAIPYSVAVAAGRRGSGLRKDEWVEVAGVLARDADGFIVEAESVRSVSVPQDPYLY
jgi:putative membrane protein